MRSRLLAWTLQGCVDLRAKLIVTHHAKEGMHLLRREKTRSTHFVRPNSHHLARQPGLLGRALKSAVELSVWAVIQKDHHHVHVHNVHVSRIEGTLLHLELTSLLDLATLRRKHQRNQFFGDLRFE